MFVLCLERLGHWIQRKVAEGVWKPLRASGGLKISHLFFVDDLLFFAEATPDQALCIKEALDCFCKASGPRVSYDKSLLFVSPNIDGQVAEDLSNIMGIPLTLELGRYLGHRLMHKGRGGDQHVSILDKVRHKLEGWKSTRLSRAGRLTLAKSVLSNMAIFYMQTQRLPERTHKELDMAVKRCIWGSLMNKRKIHLLSWETLCKTKEMGGAGIRRAEDNNKSLLAKLGWRVLTCGEEPWCRVIRQKYGVIERRTPAFKHKQRETQIWRGVVWASDLLRTGLRWRVTNGRHACFWTDRWVKDMVLMDHSTRQVEEEELIRTVGSSGKKIGVGSVIYSHHRSLQRPWSSLLK